MLKQISSYAVTTIIYILLSISLCQAQVDQYGKLQTTLTSEPLNFSDYYYSLDAIEEFKNKWVSIEQELNTSNDEWIGDYKAGMDTSFVFLRWSKKNDYVLAYVNICTYSTVMKMDYGKIAEFSSSLLHLKSTLDKQFIRGKVLHMEGDPLFSRSYVPVKWGERHYLVPKENIADFCVQVSKEFSPVEFGLYFIKQGDWEKPAYGKLLLPYEYKDLLQQHIDANVIEIVGQRSVKPITNSSIPNFYEVTSTVKLDIGSKQNITKGLSLYLGVNYDEKAKVVNVQDTTCQAIIIQNLQLTLTDLDVSNCKGEDSELLIKVGDKLFTNSQDENQNENQGENNN